MRRVLELLAWLLPASETKNSILRRFGHRIAHGARIDPNVVVGVGRFDVGSDTHIWPFNVFRGLSLVELDDHAMIKSWNWITADPQFQAVDVGAGTLHMQFGSGVGARNHLDCSGTIIVRPYGFVGGHRTFLQTHQPNVNRGTQSAGRIVVGHHSLVASCSILLTGAELPAQSVLAANSTLAPLAEPNLRRGVYAGSPATWKTTTQGEWFDRTDHWMHDCVIDAPMGPEVEDVTAVEQTALDRVRSG